MLHLERTGRDSGCLRGSARDGDRDVHLDAASWTPAVCTVAPRLLSSLVMKAFPARRMLRRPATSLAAASLLLSAASCEVLQFKGGEEVTTRSTFRENGRWRPDPVSIRVYPSTRLAVHDGQWYLEAFVECLDEMGDSTKGVGSFQFELFRSPGLEGDAGGQQLYVWNVQLHTLDDQRRHYDPTLRTYQFRLKMYPLPGDIDQVVFRVMYDNETGPRMDAQARLPARDRVVGAVRKPCPASGFSGKSFPGLFHHLSSHRLGRRLRDDADDWFGVARTDVNPSVRPIVAQSVHVIDRHGIGEDRAQLLVRDSGAVRSDLHLGLDNAVLRGCLRPVR